MHLIDRLKSALDDEPANARVRPALDEIEAAFDALQHAEYTLETSFYHDVVAIARDTWPRIAENPPMGFTDPITVFQEGYIGLLRAAQTFSAACGERFAVHAARYVRDAIDKALADPQRARERAC